MTDSTIITIVASIMGGLQVMQSAYLKYTIEKNSCGGAKCIAAMTKALNIRVERTPEAVAVNEGTRTQGP